MGGSLKEPFGLICAGGRRLGHSYNDISTINFQNYVPLPKNRHDIAYARSVSDLNLLKSLTNIKDPPFFRLFCLYSNGAYF